jgi:hypothetical protein
VSKILAKLRHPPQFRPLPPLNTERPSTST